MDARCNQRWAIMKTKTQQTTPRKSGWRPKQWADETGVSRSTVYNLIEAKKLHAVKLGRARVIVTSPADYLASLSP